MDIQTAQWNEDGTAIIINGETFVPWPSSTWHREAVKKWLEAGNAIAPARTSPYHTLDASDPAAPVWILSAEGQAQKDDVEARAELQALDAKVPRGLEDLVATLEAKGILAEADLPAELADNIARKTAARSKLLPRV